MHSCYWEQFHLRLSYSFTAFRGLFKNAGFQEAFTWSKLFLQINDGYSQFTHFFNK